VRAIKIETSDWPFEYHHSVELKNTMLERVEEIKGIGLLHDAKGALFKWRKSTIIYGDNGRGKSTLATILRSVATSDSAAIAARKTIGGTLQPSVVLQFGSGHKVTFSANQWSEARPEFSVFDADFVEKNVHSGGEVNTGHRKNLLQFALGAKAVSARIDEEAATDAAREAASQVQKIVDQLEGHHEGMSFAEFRDLPAVPDAASQIDGIAKRMVMVKGTASLLRRTVPGVVRVPELQPASLFTVFRTTIESVQDDAETTLRAHIERMGMQRGIGWLNQGLTFEHGDVCPYCGQSTKDLDLIKAYRTHFNAAYADLRARVARLDDEILGATNDHVVTSFAERVETTLAIASAWSDHATVPQIRFESVAALEKLRELRTILLKLVEEKRSSLTSACGDEADEQRVGALWADILDMMQETNFSINNAIGEIEKFRESLIEEDPLDLMRKEARLRLATRRYSPTVVSLLADLVVASAAQATAESAKAEARAALDALMRQTLCDYERSINLLLTKFGASFQIEKMDANFRGGSPRSEYGLALRGVSVPLEGGPPSFSTTLSEGDKRTLAFAFFVASTLADDQLSNRIIVVDDPMCSLDLNRKHHTRTVLKMIRDKAEQLVVLAHDIYFVRDLKADLILKDQPNSVATFRLRHESEGYTKFDAINLEKECQSPYFHHHSLLVEYTQNGTGSDRQVANAIRPLLEGYLHRRFPGLIPTDCVFGQVIAQIKAAGITSPLSHAQSLVTELNEINEYAGQFHHDTNPGNADTIPIVSTELNGIALRALIVVYRGSI